MLTYFKIGCTLELTITNGGGEKVLTKVEIAKLSGVSRVTVSKILNKKKTNVKYSTLKKIADVIGCSVEELIKEV